MRHDLRYAFRQVRKSPGFALTVVLTLALGIGATTAIFSLVEGILLRPLPFNSPDRLVLLGEHLGDRPNISIRAREIATYSQATNAFSSMGAFITSTSELSGGATPEQINTARVMATVFPTLGADPIIGRFFTRQEEDAHQPLAVISYALWLNRYHRDPGVLGNALVLDRKSYSIIGVMGRDFEFPLLPGRLNQTQVWVPLDLTADELSEQQAGRWGYQMVARLKDGVTLEQAAGDADRVAQLIMRGFPASLSKIHIHGDARLLRESLVTDIRPLLRTLFVAVAIVLLIACANVTGLLLVRAIRRQREYAVRLALGARSGVIIRGSVLEGLLLSLAGGLLGLAFAATAIRAALRLLPESMPRISFISMDAKVAIFAMLLAFASGVVCSLAPAFAALRTSLSEGLKEGTRTGTGSSSQNWLRSALVVSEIAVALVLLTVSAAFLRSFQKMRAVDPGFRPDHVVVAAYRLPANHYSTDAAVAAFNLEVTQRLSSQPGTVAVGITNVLPATGFYAQSSYTVEDQPLESWKLKFASFDNVYGDYFSAMGIPLLDGRTFTIDDRADAPPVVIVNQTMARDCWPGQRAIGKRMHAGNPQKNLPWATVIGIVADTKLGSRDEPNDEQWYFPAQQPATLFGSGPLPKLTMPGNGYVTLRSTLPQEQMAQTLRSTIAQIDPVLALQTVEPMNDAIANIEAPRRFNTDLITAFAASALLLAIIGIYAVVAFSVSLRTQEMAIRMALGAQRAGIARLVLVSGGKLALLGCGLGVIVSLAVSRLVTAFLFQVSPTDPVIYITCVGIMMLMALIASTLPAMRAASADPIKALREV